MQEINSKEEKWKQLLKDRKAFCYIKPNRYVHESGYRCFEVGYCTLDDSGKRVKEKLVLSKRSDHFWHTKDMTSNRVPLEFSMDILLDGHIRVFDREVLTWENSYDWLVSSFRLRVME